MTITVNGVSFQSNLRSKPLNADITTLASGVNNLQTQIDNLNATASASEVVNARDYHTVLKDRIQSNSLSIGTRLISGGNITEQSTPDMTIKWDLTEAIVDGIGCLKTAGSSGTITAPSANPRLDYVVLNSDNTVSILTGSESATPVFPSTASSQLILGALYLKTSTTSLNNYQEVFTFKNANNPYFPNLLINIAYTATDKKHNNVIVDLSGDLITGNLECQGNCYIINYEDNGSDGSGERGATSIVVGAKYDDNTNYTLYNISSGDTLTGSSGGGTAIQSSRLGTIIATSGGADGISKTIKAFNVYINNYQSIAGDGFDCTNTHDQNTADASWPSGGFFVGSYGGNGGYGSTLTIYSINETIINGTITLNGGSGGSGADCSNGTIANLGGKGGSGNNGGDLIIYSKSYTNNGTFTSNGGSGGSGGTGSGGSDSNGNGTIGDAGTGGSETSNIYDFTTGFPSNYGDWIHPLYKEN